MCNLFFLDQNICCEYSKGLSQWGGSFKHPNHMFSPMYNAMLATTAVMAAWNVAGRGVQVIFVFIFKFCLVLLHFLTVYQGICDRPCVETGYWIPETMSHYGLSRMIVRFLLASATFWWDLSYFVVFGSSSATSIKFCQDILRWNVAGLFLWYRKGGPWSCCNHCILTLKTSLMPMKKRNLYLDVLLVAYIESLRQQGGQRFG